MQFFLHVAGKIKCLNGKEKLRLLNTTGVSCKVSETTDKLVEKGKDDLMETK